MAKFDLGNVLGAVLGGGGAARRPRRRSGNQDLGRALAVLAGVAIEAMSRGQTPPAPAPAPPRTGGRRSSGGWGDAAPAKTTPAAQRKSAASPTRKPEPARGSVPAAGGWGGVPVSKPAPAGGGWSPVPGAPPPPAIPAEDREALLMLRAMIAAARADGHVDVAERGRIAEQLDAAGLSPAARDAALAEFERGATPEELAREARDPMLAAQLYAAAVAGAASIEGAERAWLDAFGKALRLDRAAAEAIERRITGG